MRGETASLSDEVRPCSESEMSTVLGVLTCIASSSEQNREGEVGGGVNEASVALPLSVDTSEFIL